MANPRTVVVGVDYSETGLLALKRALSLAEGGTVHVAHVVEPPAWAAAPPMLGQVAPMQVAVEDAAASLRKYVEEQVAAASKESGKPSGKVVTHLAVGGPAEEIVQLASDLDADLIVVGTHGRRGVQRFLVGSVAERVVRMATAPVLVERPKVTASEQVPQIEPPCPRCAEARKASGGTELWCEQHKQKHGRRHTYHLGQTGAAFPSAHGGLGSVS